MYINHDSIIQEALEIENVAQNSDFNENEADMTEPDTGPIINIWEDELGTLGSLARCGAHCLQLASGKVTKIYDQYINPLRQFIKHSRLAANRNIFNNLHKPSDDNITRWSSTFRMIDEFFQHKEQYKAIQHPSFDLSDNVWLFVEEFRDLFKHVDQSILYFQREYHTMCK